MRIVQISREIILNEVLHILAFRYNLMFVSRLTREGNLKLEFNSGHCWIVDPKTKRILAIVEY